MERSEDSPLPQRRQSKTKSPNLKALYHVAYNEAGKTDIEHRTAPRLRNIRILRNSLESTVRTGVRSAGTTALLIGSPLIVEHIGVSPVLQAFVGAVTAVTAGAIVGATREPISRVAEKLSVDKNARLDTAMRGEQVDPRSLASALPERPIPRIPSPDAIMSWYPEPHRGSKKDFRGNMYPHVVKASRIRSEIYPHNPSQDEASMFAAALLAALAIKERSNRSPSHIRKEANMLTADIALPAVLFGALSVLLSAYTKDPNTSMYVNGADDALFGLIALSNIAKKRSTREMILPEVSDKKTYGLYQHRNHP